MSLAERGPAISGILNVRKPTGMTSHDVVARIRHVSRIKRVGHAGTLDPAADGVLLVCLGTATRMSEYLMDSTKQYRAVVRLGATSAPDDSEGPILPGETPNLLDREQITQALAHFVGNIIQVPPRYAAIKVAGRTLYDRARSGEDFIPEGRPVTIDAIDLVTWQCPDVTIDVTCSKGTYIRSLARDLGPLLGTGGYLLSLTRTRSGDFSIEEAVNLEEISAACIAGNLASLLHPIDQAVASWPALTIPNDAVRKVLNGEGWEAGSVQPPGRARGYDQNGRLIALLRRDADSSIWRPFKVFDGDTLHGAA